MLLYSLVSPGVCSRYCVALTRCPWSLLRVLCTHSLAIVCLTACICDSWGLPLGDWHHLVHGPREPEVPSSLHCPREAFSHWLSDCRAMKDQHLCLEVAQTQRHCLYSIAHLLDHNKAGILPHIIPLLGCCFLLLLLTPISPGNNFLINHLHLNLSLMVCFWGTLIKTVWI